MNLHYSQTNNSYNENGKWSYTSMNLHYSQTAESTHALSASLIPLWIYITLKPQLHNVLLALRLIPLWIYITLKPFVSALPCLSVLYLYEFTLLSNRGFVGNIIIYVLYLYEFTLLSNSYGLPIAYDEVLYLYEFTLLSNLKFWKSSLQLVCKSTSLLYILIQ